MLQHFDVASFDAAVASNSVVLVDFWATWCGPCRMIAPFIEEIAKDYEGRAVVGKVDVDEHPELAERFGIASIPTVLIFKNGKLVDKTIGAGPKSTYSDMLDRQLA